MQVFPEIRELQYIFADTNKDCVLFLINYNRLGEDIISTKEYYLSNLNEELCAIINDPHSKYFPKKYFTVYIFHDTVFLQEKCKSIYKFITDEHKFELNCNYTGKNTIENIFIQCENCDNTLILDECINSVCGTCNYSIKHKCPCDSCRDY